MFCLIRKQNHVDLRKNIDIGFLSVYRMNRFWNRWYYNHYDIL